jgi:uncharacterized protein YqgC (DUF456 family)
MDWLFILAIICIFIGIAGTFLPVLPGIPVVFLGMLTLAWLDHFQTVSMTTTVVLGLIALIAFIVDFALAFVTTKKAGASKYALWGVVIGSLVGLLLGGVGIFIGAILGALIGEFLVRRDLPQATSVGLSSGLGFVIAFVVKLVLLVLILGIFAYAYLN